LPFEPRFFGKFEHSLDSKGRIILPARFRQAFDAQPFLTPHLEGCLALWTREEFERESEAMLARAGGDAVSRNAVREWASQVSPVELDRQGRMPVPAELRTYAGLSQEVLVVGVINHVELWSPERWASKDGATGAPATSESPTTGGSPGDGPAGSGRAVPGG